MNDPKPEWRDGVPWCSRDCPALANKGLGCVCAITDAPLMNLSPCAPAVRRLVEALEMIAETCDPERGGKLNKAFRRTGVCDCDSCIASAALPPEPPK